MSTFVTILLIAIPLAIGVLTIQVNEQLRDLKKHHSPDNVKSLIFDLTKYQD